jgi:hypothetical protein
MLPERWSFSRAVIVCGTIIIVSLFVLAPIVVTLRSDVLDKEADWDFVEVFGDNAQRDADERRARMKQPRIVNHDGHAHLIGLR